MSGGSKFCGIIVAAGRGVRFGRPKQLVEVAGRPLIAWSLATFGAMREIEHLVVATEPEHIEGMQRLAATWAQRLATSVIAGGATRQGSVRAALAAVPPGCDAVFVHDGARPLVQVEDVRSGMALVKTGVASLLATPVVDTIKAVAQGSRTVAGTLDRRELWAAQTPQFAMLADLRRAHEAAQHDQIEATDDAALLERIGIEVLVVPASGENFKVTLRGDRDLAETILRERSSLVPKR
jgi:2-C-methyl-D-erythritol 4-phosphate cytidylyltransferase